MVSVKIKHDFETFLNDYKTFLGSPQFNTYFNPNKHISLMKINNFFKDSEHGFFHGVMVSFICFLINDQPNFIERNNDMYQLYASATLHDFLKPNGVPQKEHDILLRSYYNKLCEETYSHSSPPLENQEKHLIIADRLELRRYKDYKEWVDDRFYDLYAKMSPELNEKLNYFYDYMRPNLETNFNQHNTLHGTKFESLCQYAKSRMICLCNIYT